MNARRVNAAAGVISAAQKTKQTAAGIAASLEAAQLLQSPESAAEVVALRARVAELEAQAEQTRIEAIADVGDWFEEIGEKGTAYLVRTHDIPAARDMRVVSREDPHESPLHHTYAICRDLPEVAP